MGRGTVRGEVAYGTTLEQLRPVRRGSRVRYWEVAARSGGRQVTYQARNVVLATGITPVLPEAAVASERVWHSSELLDRLSALDGRDGLRFAVIGAGQSAAEATAYLHQRYTDAQIHMVMSRYGYSAADDSPFTNRVFNPEAVDAFFAAPPEIKQRYYDYHSGTNYSVADGDVIGDLFRRFYIESVHGHRRLHLLNLASVAEIAE